MIPDAPTVALYLALVLPMFGSASNGITTPGSLQKKVLTSLTMVHVWRSQTFFYEAFFFCLPSTVRRKRYDSVPVSMMCARSVMRSSSALHSQGKLVVTITSQHTRA